MSSSGDLCPPEVPARAELGQLLGKSETFKHKKAALTGAERPQ